MIRLRQEQTVFALTVLALGAMTWGLFGARSSGLRGSRGGDEAEFDHYRAPDVKLALADDATPPLSRELFSPPRDTRPLPPLPLVEPPRRALAELVPPTDPGPAPAAYGQVLRRDLAPLEAAGLFGGETEADDVGAAGDDLTGGELAQLADLGYVGDADETSTRELLQRARGGGAADPFADETPAERATRYAAYRQRYDWVQRGPGQYQFGRIENEDRYGLKTDPKRATEAVSFVEVDPETGREVLASVGAPAVSLARELLVDYGFAETVVNEIGLRRHAIGAELTRGTFDDAMTLAGYAVRHRHEAPRALRVAEELYRLCIAYDPEDPEPRLGLARALEAGFRFEEAFALYTELLETFGHRAEPHVRLALLEERFLLLDQAEERLERAVSVDRGNWEARWGLGGFLARRGRHDEALEHLRAAVRAAPSEPELLFVRVLTRNTLADALLALGELAEARSVYEQALAADETDQTARAGRMACDLYAGQPIAASAGDEGEGFDLLLARGVGAILEGRPTEARDLLTLAVEADPLRASEPLAALGFLARAAGYEPDASAFLQEAVERDPGNAYALYVQGRMLGEQDDYEGARASLLAALDLEIDFEDALVALGETAFRLGRFEDAERYLERALAIDPERPEVHALRGVNFLRLSSVADAQDAFDAALALDRAEPTAKAGLAWCAYLSGDVTQGLVLLADLDDSRRDQPETDPWRVWSQAQIDRVQDHVEKVEWRDNFNRTRLINGWLTRESDGPTVGMTDGAVKIEGVFTKREGKAQVYREYVSSDFVSFAADVRITGRTATKCGVFIAREQQRRQEVDVIGEASVGRHGDGSLQVRFVRKGQPVDVTDMQQPFPTDEWVRLTIERSGTSSDTRVTISMDGIPLVREVPVPSVGGANSPILVGLFVEGDAGQEVLVEMDEASVVYRGNR